MELHLLGKYTVNAHAVHDGKLGSARWHK